MVGPFSMFLSVPNHGGGGGGGGGGSHDTMEMMYSSSSSNYASSYSYYSSAPSSSSVDCTLSLGTPSTRLTQLDDHHHHHRRGGGRRPAGSCVSNFCWDLLHPKQKTTAARAGGNGNNAAAASGGGDPLLARRCANCDTTSTPLWRNGPKGPKSLCNACGIRFKKEERRAAATVNITAAGVAAEPNHHHHNMFGGWTPHENSAATTTRKLPCLSPAAISNESMFVGNDDVRRSEPENGMSFLSWRLNVTDHRPNLVHDFTRS